MVTILDGITKKVCVNFEQIIPEVASTEDETPTSQSYFVQGWSRLDGVDIRKTKFERRGVATCGSKVFPELRLASCAENKRMGEKILTTGDRFRRDKIP